ncbi:hypothetical protein C0J52_27994 [Blattella germanica]|nr:hypothetical protein C0J52_27994 [Blattella germanica]
MFTQCYRNIVHRKLSFLNNSNTTHPHFSKIRKVNGLLEENKNFEMMMMMINIARILMTCYNPFLLSETLPVCLYSISYLTSTFQKFVFYGSFAIFGFYINF